MTSPKYDPNNYVKHQAIPIIQNNHKINESFGSYLLMVKWWSVNIDKILPKPDLIGKLRIHLTTPFGDLEPQEYRLKVSDSKKVYVQFLSMPQPDFNYRIEVIHPQGITRSHLEIWEYIPPQTFTNSTPNMPFYPESGDSNPELQALIDATNNNAVAIGSMATAINAQPDAIADALEGDDISVLDPVIYTLGTTPTLISTASDENKGLLISNQGNSKIKIWVSESALPPTTGYTSGGYIFDMTGKGSYEMPEPFYKSNIFAISNNANGIASVTKSVRTGSASMVNG